MKVLQLIALLFISNAIGAQQVPESFGALLPSIASKVIEWRRYIHQHPELGNREVNTAALVADHLRKLGLEVRTQVAVTGVVGILRGGKPGPVVALRADMDALPVLERANLAFKSTVSADYLGQTVPVMHACGHDSHVAILMGTAEALVALKKDVPGTVVFIFQPAEEGPPGDEEGGAPLMIKQGVLDQPKVDAIFGLHINSKTPIGTIKYKLGSVMASSDWFTIKVKGKQSHGSQPWSGIDPIVVSAQIINGIQTIVSRQSDLTQAPVVVTVGKIQSGVRANIIPEETLMEGTIRTLDGNMQKEVHVSLKKMATAIASASNASADVSIVTKTLVTYNHPQLTQLMLPALQKAAGKNNVIEEVWTTGAEDFSFFSDKIPGLFFFLGGMPVGVNVKDAAPHHTPDFYIDDSRLDVGVKAFVEMVFAYAALPVKPVK